MPKRTNKYFIALTVAVWAVLIVGGWAVMSKYQDSPGPMAISIERWPETSKLERTDGLPTLLMFVHPFCPCTRSSVNQLAHIMAVGLDKVRTQVVFIKHPQFSMQEVKGGLWKSAGEIPGVETVVDDLGVEAKLFHASVSGQVMLFDVNGQLIYNGGITVSRGHEGDNEGQDEIIAFLTNGKKPAKQKAPFGCLLFSKN